MEPKNYVHREKFAQSALSSLIAEINQLMVEIEEQRETLARCMVREIDCTMAQDNRRQQDEALGGIRYLSQRLNTYTKMVIAIRRAEGLSAW